MADSAEEVRANGFQWPLHPLQVVSWIVFGADVIVYAVLCIPMIETVAAQVIVSLCFVISVGFLVVSTFMATSCNPMDPFVLRDEADFKEEELEELPYCGLCATTVQARSKHCRACNKCVASFDHHCMWLNNCIGGDNYRAFFVSISSVAVMIGIVLGTILYQFIDYFTNEDFESRLQASPVHSGVSMEAFLVTLIAMSVVNVPLWALDMQLVLLHVYLMHQNLTTYEYIMNRRQQDEGSSKFRGLPRCMDWIVFSRCGQRRQKKKDKIEKIDEIKPAPDVEAAQQLPEQGPVRPVPATSAEAPPGSADGSASSSKKLEAQAVANRDGALPLEVGSGKMEIDLLTDVDASNKSVQPSEVDKMTRGIGANGEVALVEQQSEVASGPTVGVPQVGCGCDGSSTLSRDAPSGKAAV